MSHAMIIGKGSSCLFSQKVTLPVLELQIRLLLITQLRTLMVLIVIRRNQSSETLLLSILALPSRVLILVFLHQQTGTLAPLISLLSFG